MAVKKNTARWSGNGKKGNAAAGKKAAASDRKLQRDAEQRRPRTEKAPSKKESAAQMGAAWWP